MTETSNPRVCRECRKPADGLPFCASCGGTLTEERPPPGSEGNDPPPAALPLGRPIRRRRGRRLLAVAVAALVGIWLGMQTDLAYYRVSSGSMEPTLQIGDRVSIEKSHTPQVGDIVVFHPPEGAVPTNPICGSTGQGMGSPQPCGVATTQEARTTFIKRVVAGPGDLVSVVAGHAVRNGIAENEPYIAPCDNDARCDFPTPVRVPPGNYYLLGDNRPDSDDSRYWGPVPSSWIIGTVVHCSLFGMVCTAVH